jgi:ABC-type antimicrobial peptide transport system permease subunit
MALGADRKAVLRLVIGQGVVLAGIGIVAGVIAALGVTQFIKTLLYNVTASDPASFGLVAVFLGLVAVIASYVPARRAMAVDPIIALRND